MVNRTEYVSPPERYCKVGPIPVPYVELTPQDGRKPLIILNGLSMPPGKLGQFPGELAVPAIAVGVPGPEHTRAHPTLSFYAKTVANAIEQVVGRRPYDVLGFSWGGLLAEQLVAQGEPVEKLVQVATMPATPASWACLPDFKAMMLLLSPDRRAEDAATIYGGDFRRNPALAETLGITREIDMEHHLRQIRAAVYWFGPLVMQTMANKLLLRRRPETLVMAGNDDPIIPYSGVVGGAFALGARLRTVSDGGHGFLFTRPPETASHVNDFLLQGE